MPTPIKSRLTEVPPAVFSAFLAAALRRSDTLRRQHSPCNDGRTGFIVNY